MWFGSRLHNQEKNPPRCFHHPAALQRLSKGREQVQAFRLRRGCDVIILVQVSREGKLQQELV